MKPSPPSGSVLSPDDARRILSADLANIVKRTRDGKALTASQRQLVQNLSAGELSSKLVAKSRAELAEVLGVHRNTLMKWEKLSDAPKPAANGERDVGAWREWMRATGKSSAENDRRTQLEERRLELLVESLELDNAVRRRDFVPVAEVRAEAAQVGGRIKSAMLALPDSLAQSLAGLSPAEISERLRSAVTECLRHLAESEFAE